MTQLSDNMAARRQDWIQRATTLIDQISSWAAAEGWHVDREPKNVHEPLLGTYEIPTLTIRLPGGELLVNPVGLHIVGGDGRVDIEATPTLSRVKLIGDNGSWIVMTDSNVPLRITWDAPHFIELAHDLLA
jgi:hypothetical protein